MTKAEAGQKGGKATAKKYGKDYMSKIGKKGAKTFWGRYKLVKCGTSDFLIVYRDTGISTGKTLNGSVFS